MDWTEAKDVKADLENIVKTLELSHIRLSQVFCYRTEGSEARAYARTWAFPKIFQKALTIAPSYVIEVISKYYDPLEKDEQVKVLIHELLHIPNNFSGALLPHVTRSRHLGKTANQLYKTYKLKQISQVL